MFLTAEWEVLSIVIYIVMCVCVSDKHSLCFNVSANVWVSTLVAFGLHTLKPGNIHIYIYILQHNSNMHIFKCYLTRISIFSLPQWYIFAIPWPEEGSLCLSLSVWALFGSTVTITCCNTREKNTERATVALICELYYKCNYTSGSSDVDVCSRFAVN